jgi:Secretion system C-terminal sorting domain
MVDFASLKAMQLALNNDWASAHPNQITDIELWANNPQSSAYGAAIAVLQSLEITDVLPEPELPFEDRGLFSLNIETREAYIPELAAYPNPAIDRTFVTYPTDADGIGTLKIYDSMGQLISSYPLNNKGIFELETDKLSVGIYLLSIVVEGKTLVESKLVVAK